MTEPAELLLIKDQYMLAFQSLSCGLGAEEADRRSEALMHYRKAQIHLTQGLEIPTGGDRHQGIFWDTARQLQEKMMDTQKKLRAHLSNLKMSHQTTREQRGLLLKDLPPSLYPDLASIGPPPNSPPHHLYPTKPPTSQDTTSHPKPIPVRAALHALSPPAAAQGTLAMNNPGDQPPAYTPKPTEGHRSLTHCSTEGSFGPNGAAIRGNESELLCIPSGVQLFFVEPNGQVSTLSYPGYLRIVTFDNQNKASAAERSSACLHVCDRVYALTPDTPVLLANSGIFMFPDTLTEKPGCYVGIVLSSELPATDRELFQDLISQLSELRIQDPEVGEVINLSAKVQLNPPNEEEKVPLPGWSEKIGQRILSGATRLSQSLAKGAEATGRAINKGGVKLRDRITPEETPTVVNPHVSKSLNVAKQATGGAVRVSQLIVNGMSAVAEHVADKVTPHVKKHGGKLIPESLKKSQDGQASKLDGAKFVAVSSIQGLSTVWSSLETGAKHVCKGVATETVSTVKYNIGASHLDFVSHSKRDIELEKTSSSYLPLEMVSSWYGHDAGRATETGLTSVANVGVAAYNFDNLSLTTFMKTTGKMTSKNVVGCPKGDAAEINGNEVETERESAQCVEEEQRKKEEKKKE